MRSSSRLLSVLLALVLVGISLLTVSAHDGTSHTESNPTYGARVILTRTDNKDPVHPGTLLTFSVYVQRGSQHGIPSAATLTSSGSTSETLGDALLVGSRQAITKEIEYTVQPSDLGGAVRRAAPIRFTLTFTPVDTDGSSEYSGVHPEANVLSNDFPVIITKKSESSSGDGSSEVEIVFSVQGPEDIEEGEEVEFSVSAVTGKYALVTKPLIIRKRLYDDNGDRIGPTTHAKSVIIRYLNTNSVSEEHTATYVLTERDSEATTIEFFYELTLEDTDLRTADGGSTDLNEDYEETLRDSHIIGRRLVSATPTPNPSTVRPTATPIPNQFVGSTSAVRVTRQGNDRIFFNLTHGQDFSMNIGFIAPDGTRAFHRSGYVRDESLGQTYAVVVRESDNRVVRVWISPDDPIVNEIPWPEVLEFYDFHRNIVDAIPLDEMHPAPNQLVDAGGRFYVYYAGEWRHIPDIPTFQARNFYWCDMTSADANWLRRVSIGRPLQSSGGTADPNYPNCRN